MSDISINIFEHIFFEDEEKKLENDIFFYDELSLTNNFQIPCSFPPLLHFEPDNHTKPTSTTTIRVHDNNSYDNLLRKIQNHFMNFIVSFLNEYLKENNIDKNFCKLDYNFKKQVNKKFVNDLKTKSLRDIIINNISIKYSKHENDANKNYLEDIENNEIYKKEITELKKILSINYMDFFRKVYYKSERYVNLKEFGISKIITLSNKVEMFNDLLNQNKYLGEQHVKNIHKCALKSYFPGYLFFCEK